MKPQDAKEAIAVIVRGITDGEDIYVLDHKYIRWGAVQKELGAIMEAVYERGLTDGISLFMVASAQAAQNSTENMLLRAELTRQQEITLARWSPDPEAMAKAMEEAFQAEEKEEKE